MAEPITKKQLKKLDISKYDAIRHELSTGYFFSVRAATLFHLLFSA